MTNDPSIVEEFVIEAQEHMETVEDDFLQLEQNMDAPDPEIIDKVFRAVHSVKGGAGFLQFGQIQNLAHAMETLLSAIRSGKIGLDSEIISTLLEGCDQLNAMLEEVHTSNDVEISDIVARLEALMDSRASTETKADLETCLDVGGSPDDGIPFEISKFVFESLPESNPFLYILKFDLGEMDKKGGKSPVQLIKTLMSIGQIVDARLIPMKGDLADGMPEGTLDYEVLFSTILEPSHMSLAIGLAEERVIEVDRESVRVHEDRPEEAEESGGEAPGGPEASVAEQPHEPETESEPEGEGLTEEQQAALGPDFGGDEMVLPITPELIEQYVSESDEMLERIEQCFVEMTDTPERSEELIEEAFRLSHSIKGNSGLLGFKSAEVLAHRMESLLDRVREGEIVFDEPCEVAFLRGVDALKGAVGDLSDGGSGAIPDMDLILEMLDVLIEGKSLDSISIPEPAEPAKPTPPEPQMPTELPRTVAEAEAAEKRQAQKPAPAPQAAATAAPKPASRPARSARKESPPPKKIERRDIRVDLEKLDVLINLVGELVIAEAMVTGDQDLQGLELPNFERSAHNLRRIISDLQDVAMAVRMIPLSRTFRKMIRLVHDLSKKAGKQVKLDLVGEDTEVDKTVIEQIADPLVHIIRNSVDHGIDTLEERRAAGKSDMGHITIKAMHQGGEVLIQIIDDGRGLNRQKILNKAVEKGLVKGDGSDLSDEKVFNLIFEPGFSTADKITDVSGRGVGMDVVRRNLDNLKGRVDVRSMAGQGTTVTLRIPLTLAIIEGMLIRVGTNRYTIPMLSIRESFRPSLDQVTITPDGQEVVTVRDELIPVVRLHEMHGTTPDSEQLDQGILVIVTSGPKQVCVFADEILGQHQTVIKAMPGYVKHAQGFSGCTILGNGEVSLILDVSSLIERAEGQAWMESSPESAEVR